MADDNIVRLSELQAAGLDNSVTEDAMALEFAEQHEQHLRYVAAWGRWLDYKDTHWAYDDTLHVFDLAREVCRETAAACLKPPSVIAAAKTVAAIERLAKADRRLAATISQWDAKPWLLTAGKETFDLRTGTGRAPEPLDYITKGAACAAAPAGTPHPVWTAFLDRITDHNIALQQFLQRYAGYCCTGATDEHVFVFAYGTGANGKSTFINTLTTIFGDYATTADMGTFLASNVERHPADLAKLHGARLVVAQETQKGRRWDETKIKTLTGGDRITARFMRQDYFDFTPAFKLFITGNHKPRLDSADEAMRRRLLLVPFTVQIPAAERDPELPRKLLAEAPAILRWCIEGCLEWQHVGLAPPVAVLDATGSYFADQDLLQLWLDDCADAEPKLDAFTRIKDLFSSWKAWCEDRNHRPGNMTALSDMLADRGFVKTRQGRDRHRGFAGINLRQLT